MQPVSRDSSPACLAWLLQPCSCGTLASSKPAGLPSLPCCSVDVAPPGQFSCTEQQAWGMCDALNGTAFCAATCELGVGK